MKHTPYRLTTLASVVGIALAMPLAASAADYSKDKASNHTSAMTYPAYSDRANMQNMRVESDALERALKTGQTGDAYMKQLKQMGFQITAVNDRERDYLEFEIVKGRNSHEVQIDRDTSTGRATKIDVTNNMWRADSTKAALRGNAFEPMMTSQYSDRRYSKGWTDEKEMLRQSMPAGQDAAFYASKLKQMGYQITANNDPDKGEMEYEVVKGQNSYEVQLNIDERTGKVKEVEVSSNLWQADATERALERRN